MLELVLILCLSASPTECRVERQPFDGSLNACAFAGQFQAAAWLAVHPGYTLRRWRCGPPERSA